MVHVISPQVSYFENGSYTPIPESVLQACGSVNWTKFGLAIKAVQTADCGAGVMDVEVPGRFSAMHIVLHLYQKLDIHHIVYQCVTRIFVFPAFRVKKRLT